MQAVPGWVLAVDAASQSGWALYGQGRLLASGSCDLNSDEVEHAVELALGGPGAPRLRKQATVLVLEKPFRSGHVSAYVGLGAAIGVWKRAWFRAGGGVRRIVRVQAMSWRARVLGAVRGASREQWKALAIQRARAMFPGVSDDNQAEAILIGFWASHQPATLELMPSALRGAE
jgi:hypothetical protein